MKTIAYVLPLLFTLTTAHATSEKIFSFDRDSVGAAPAGFLSSSDAWRVTAERQAVSAPHVLMPPRSVMSGGQASLLMVKNASVEDGDMGLRFRVLQEGRPAMVGFFWRYQDASNFYAVQIDLGSETVTLVRFLKGKPKVLKSESIMVTSPVWHAFQVHVNGRRISVVFGDAAIIEVTDKSILKAGQLGIQASPGDAVQIDDFAYRPRTSALPK